MRTDKIILLTFAAAAALCSCAKLSTSEGTNVPEKRYVDAWMYLRFPQVYENGPVGMGSYFIEDIPGQGDTVLLDNYIFWEYEIRTLDSTIVSYNTETIARKMNAYSPLYDYGAEAKKNSQGTMNAGEIEILAGGSNSKVSYGPMLIGGSRKVLVPGWLTSTGTYYSSASDYLGNITGTDYLYNIKVTGQTNDIIKWQVDSIMRTKLKVPAGYVMTAEDSVKCHKGNLFLKHNESREIQRGVQARMDYNFPSDTTFYINYVGRLLNGKVFDTNIADTAKVHGLWSASGSYGPASVTASSDSTAFKLSSSSVINGFSLALYHMHPYESATAIMTSDYGYTNTDKEVIRPYSSLIFEIDIVDKP